jgi:hypothetical protein
MKRQFVVAALGVFVAIAAAHAKAETQDAAPCAALQTRYETEFKRTVVKAIGTLDRKERCEIGREGMAILDKLAAATENCPAQATETSAKNSGDRVADLAARMKIINDGESIREMVARRKASFARACGR